MGKVIYKYPLDLGEWRMPSHADFKPVFVHEQNGVPTLWAEVDPSTEDREYLLFVIGTGHPVPLCCEYVGSAMCGVFVWHVYIR